MAGDRIYLYIRCLPIPAARAFELSLHALKAAEHEVKGNPVAAAMTVLNELLQKERSTINGLDNLLNYWHSRSWSRTMNPDDTVPDSKFKSPALHRDSMPTIRRRHMTPRKINPILFGHFIWKSPPAS